jgi:hypothetical protein
MQTMSITLHSFNIGFREKRLFFAENGEKSLKIVIITSTPGRPGRDLSHCLASYLHSGTHVNTWALNNPGHLRRVQSLLENTEPQKGHHTNESEYLYLHR